MTAVTLAMAAADLLVNMRLKKPTILIGPVGVGKTDVVRQCAAKLAIEYGSYTVIEKRASEMDPTDLQVPMPNLATGKIVSYLPDWLPDVARDGAYGCILFDELSDAPTGVQAVLNQIILDRRVGSYRLPDGWTVTATGNTQKDRAAAQRFSRATSNRLKIIEIMVDVKAWIAWASGANIAPEIIAYVQNAEVIGVNTGNDSLGRDTLHKYPSGNGSDATPFVSPRSLSDCSPYLGLSLNDNELKRHVSYSCGDDTAVDFLNFLATYRLIPDINAILSDPVNATVHREPSVNFALVVAMVSRLNATVLSAAATYAKRLSPAYRVAFWTNAMAKDAALVGKPGFMDIANTAEYVAYCLAQQSPT
jgi:hypothetical protein